MDGSVSTLAPVFAAAFATHNSLGRFPGGPGRLHWRGHQHGLRRSALRRWQPDRPRPPWIRGLVCGLMTDARRNRAHAAVPHFRFPRRYDRGDRGGAGGTRAITWIRAKYMDTPIWSAALQVGFGGALVSPPESSSADLSNYFPGGQYKPAWEISSRIYATRFARCAKRPCSPRWRCSRWRWASARTPRFSRLVNQLILQLLPVRDPEQLVMLAGARPALRQQQRPQRDLLPDVPGHSATRTNVPGHVLPLRRRRFSLTLKAAPNWSRANWCPAIISRCWASAPRWAASSRPQTI